MKTHRSFVGVLICAVCFVASVAIAQTSPQTQPVPIGWLDQTPPGLSTGVSWGVPWPRGAVKKDQAFALKTADGQTLGLQTWPMAYWPDGSLKWSGFATTANTRTAGPLALTTADAMSAGTSSVQVKQSADAVDIDTGYLQCRIPKHGEYLIDSMTIGGNVVARNGRLEGIVQKGNSDDVASPSPRSKFASDISNVTVEQSGPVRAVVKISGMHKYEDGSRTWLPFYVRLYFYAGKTPMRMVHTFVFDGDEKQDFIRELGIVFDVPMREEVQNRHIRFGGEGGGLWAEPIEPMTGYNRGVNSPDGTVLFPQQVAGGRMPNKADLDDQSKHTLETWAVWDDFRLIQPNANGFTIEKRTNADSTWIAAGAGNRASGLVFAGDVSGGLAVGMKNFWQSYPTSLEVRHAKSAAAELRVWIWSPDAPAMDLRHYDTVAHGLNESYEDVQPGLSTPNGIARTTELTLWGCEKVPSDLDLSRDALATAQPPMLVCTPEYLHSVGALGIWSLPDSSTPWRKTIEDGLNAEIAFYEKAVDQYNWYGFWDYGDVMHSYDGTRHVWKYDIGGFAWDDDEQCTEVWLWYSFLRTGRADIYRMAEAMTRQISEVDCYHQGKLAGLGSRHNVRHWGDGAKEIRISQAEYRRFYYYLSTDERVGDVMHEMLQSSDRVAQFDPMREALPATASDAKFPARIRGGPDWLALVGNWMTEWERTGDTKWRDRIYAGVDSIEAMPYWFRTSQSLVWGYYPDTGKLMQRDNNLGGYNLVNNMGGPEVMMELNTFIDRPDWVKVWLQYCRMSSCNDPAMMKRDQTTGNEDPTARFAGGGRMSAYAYYMTHNVAYAKKAISGIGLRGGGAGGWGGDFSAMVHLAGPELYRPLDEPRGLNGLITNNVNQNSLQAIEVLELCKDQLP